MVHVVIESQLAHAWLLRALHVPLLWNHQVSFAEATERPMSMLGLLTGMGLVFTGLVSVALQIA